MSKTSPCPVTFPPSDYTTVGQSPQSLERERREYKNDSHWVGKQRNRVWKQNKHARELGIVEVWMRNVPLKFLYVNIWALVGSAVWEVSGILRRWSLRGGRTSLGHLWAWSHYVCVLFLWFMCVGQVLSVCLMSARPALATMLFLSLTFYCRTVSSQQQTSN